MVEADEHERVDAVLHELLRDAHLGLQVVVMRREHERIAARVRFALQRARRAGVERVVEGRHDGADHVALAAAQRARGAVRNVAQLVDRGAHARERRRIDRIGQVQRARHRRRRDAGQPRDVARARALRAGRRSGVVDARHRLLSIRRLVSIA